MSFTKKESNKIIIFSEDADFSTSVIIKWIYAKGAFVKRINVDDPKLSIESITNQSATINTSFGAVQCTTSDFYWFRRANYYSIFILNEQNEEQKSKRSFQLVEKKHNYESLIYWILNECKHSSNPFDANIAKVDVLIKAKQCGLLVPEWIMTNTKLKLCSFIKRHKHVAIKYFTSLSYEKDNAYYKNLTNKISENDLNAIPESFETTFFQNYIDKKYELRAFYFHGTFFTMAILSQADTQTAIDFRNYNSSKPNRRVPFNLPKIYTRKLVALASKLKIDTGSFDILVDHSDKYYFLEVNPVGQFGMTSIPCNYHIEEHIATTLINLLNQNE